MYMYWLYRNSFVPLQLYIILIRPERNVRQSMMPVRYSAINKTSNSGQSMMATVMVTAATCNQKKEIEKHVPTPTDDTKGKSHSRIVFWRFIGPSRKLKLDPVASSSPTLAPCAMLIIYQFVCSPPCSRQLPSNTRKWPRRPWGCVTSSPT